MNVAVDPDEGEGEVQVVFGTTNLKMLQRRRDFFVTNLAEMDQCGLDKATRFDLDKIAWLPWANEWFDCLPGYTSPIIGHLSHHSTRLLQIELAHRHAARIKAMGGDED